MFPGRRRPHRVLIFFSHVGKMVVVPLFWRHFSVTGASETRAIGYIQQSRPSLISPNIQQ